jgi:flagellar biosynthesis/type III secretory pathway protein FliH
MKVMRTAEATGAQLKALVGDPGVKVMRGGVVARVEQALEALEAARAEAEALVASARAEADAIREAARAAGQEQGVREVMGALVSARGEYARLIGQAEADMVALALGVAERLVRARLEVDAGLMASLVAGVLEQVRGKRQVVIWAHPADVPALEASRGRLVAEVEGAALYIEADERVGRGGCVVETEAGRVDARLEVQLDVMRRVLTGGV